MRRACSGVEGCRDAREQTVYPRIDFRRGQVNHRIGRHEDRYVRIAERLEQTLRDSLERIRHDERCRNAAFFELDTRVATPQRTSASIRDTRDHDVAFACKRV